MALGTEFDERVAQEITHRIMSCDFSSIAKYLDLIRFEEAGNGFKDFFQLVISA